MIKLEHKKIGNYLMLNNKKVAQLKHSAIYLGLNIITKKKVLIKLISRQEYESNDILMNSFNFEFNTMNLLKEENILKAIELIITEKNYYLILEEPQGESLKKILLKNGPMKENQLRTSFRKLTAIFKALQNHNIIHGNINTKSILLHHQQPKLGYPSYIKTIQVLKTNSTLTHNFSMGQTTQKQQDYSYLPPELLSTGMVSLKHDIWSLGVVAYESLCGKLPWNFNNVNSPHDMAHIITSSTINFPTEVKLTKQMKHFILGCLQLDPFRRFSWDEVLEHKILKEELNELQYKQHQDDPVSLEDQHPFLWMKLDHQGKSMATMTQ